MKKTHLLLAVAAFALASCSQDEPVSTNEGRAISFRPAMGSRATEITNDNLSSINVTAFLGSQTFFSDLDFVKDGTYFVSTPEYHWPGDDSELSFYAYAPSNPGAPVTISNSSKMMTDFSPAASTADQVDFITATATGKKSLNEGTGVPLTFNHQLAQIEILAKSDNDAYTFKISGMRIGQPVSKGTFTFDDSAWTLGTDKAIYEESCDEVTLTPTAVSVMGEGGNAILIPQQLTAWDINNDAANANKGAYLSVKLQINTAAGAQVYPFASNADCDWAAMPIDTDWQPGKKYIYTLDFSHGAGYVDPNDPVPGTPVLGGPIKFTVDVVDWEPENVDVPMKTYDEAK